MKKLLFVAALGVAGLMSANVEIASFEKKALSENDDKVQTVRRAFQLTFVTTCGYSYSQTITVPDGDNGGFYGTGINEDSLAALLDEINIAHCGVHIGSYYTYQTP